VCFMCYYQFPTLLVLQSHVANHLEMLASFTLPSIEDDNHGILNKAIHPVQSRDEAPGSGGVVSTKPENIHISNLSIQESLQLCRKVVAEFAIYREIDELTMKVVRWHREHLPHR